MARAGAPYERGRQRHVPVSEDGRSLMNINQALVPLHRLQIVESVEGKGRVKERERE